MDSVSSHSLGLSSMRKPDHCLSLDLTKGMFFSYLSTKEVINLSLVNRHFRDLKLEGMKIATTQRLLNLINVFAREIPSSELQEFIDKQKAKLSILKDPQLVEKQFHLSFMDFVVFLEKQMSDKGVSESKSWKKEAMKFQSKRSEVAARDFKVCCDLVFSFHRGASLKEGILVIQRILEKYGMEYFSLIECLPLLKSYEGNRFSNSSTIGEVVEPLVLSLLNEEKLIEALTFLNLLMRQICASSNSLVVLQDRRSLYSIYHQSIGEKMGWVIAHSIIKDGSLKTFSSLISIFFSSKTMIKFNGLTSDMFSSKEKVQIAIAWLHSMGFYEIEEDSDGIKEQVLTAYLALLEENVFDLSTMFEIVKQIEYNSILHSHLLNGLIDVCLKQNEFNMAYKMARELSDEGDRAKVRKKIAEELNKEPEVAPEPSVIESVIERVGFLMSFWK